MSDSGKLMFVIIGTLLMEVVTLSLTAIFRGLEGLPTGLGRTIATMGLLLFLYKRHNWARLLVGVFTGLGFIVSIFVLFSIFASGGPLNFLLSWQVIIAIFCGLSSYFMLVDRGVKSQFQ